MSNTKPVVLIFRDDYKRIEEWVWTYPDSETGGQMFGLWTQDRCPYINIITGPGKNSRHGTHSFHQDIEYLKSVGNFLNKEFMMCHIGEWHSHHKLRLRQPSTGDLNSIWKHFPAGVEHFLLIIATIEGCTVRLNPWLFTASSHTHNAIEVRIIEKKNVFMLDEVVANQISSGAETLSQPQNPPADDYPLTQAKAPPKQHVKTKNDSEWFQTDWGARFLQVLNSELEKIIDASTNIEKTLEKQCVQFSFQRKKCSVVLVFPKKFPTSILVAKCKVPGRSSPIAWQIDVQTSQDDVEIVNQIIHHLKEHIHEHIINVSEAKTPSQPQNPPADDYPLTEAKAPPKQQVKTKNDSEWFETDWGARFLQVLNSELEKIIDSSTNIEKTLEQQCVQFSFQRKKCAVVLIFPQKFPTSTLIAKCKVPGRSSPIPWQIYVETSQDVEMVNEIVHHLKKHTDEIMSQYC